MHRRKTRSPGEFPPGASPLGWVLQSPGRAILAVCLFLAATLSLYVDRMTFLHEEPRRAIVAQEMLLSEDYVAPTVFQRPYFKKPPLHNWLIALAALPDGAVSHREARTVSLVAFFLLGGAVYLLLRRASHRTATVAFLITMTTYLMACEYGNRAEPDMLLALFAFLAYFFYIRRPFHWPHLLLSSLFMGMGILTKGVSPLFFYPGLLVWILLGGQPRARGLAYCSGHGAIWGGSSKPASTRWAPRRAAPWASSSPTWSSFPCGSFASCCPGRSFP